MLLHLAAKLLTRFINEERNYTRQDNCSGEDASRTTICCSSLETKVNLFRSRNFVSSADLSRRESMNRSEISLSPSLSLLFIT